MKEVIGSVGIDIPDGVIDRAHRACLDKAKVYKRYVKNGRTNIDQLSLHNFASYSENLISDAKTRYLSSLGEKLNNPQIGCKTYWSILNKFVHKKKIPLIPPIFSNNNYVTDISEKAHLFNIFFANQCKIIQNKSTLPVAAGKPSQHVGQHLPNMLRRFDMSNCNI